MRKVLVIVAIVALISVGYALGKPTRPTLAAPATQALTGACAKANLKTVEDGKLTIGTTNPAFPPWFGGTPPKGSKWKTSNPYSGKGYESAVAYQAAKRLGFARSAVQWTAVPFDKSYAPGKKPFDFYLAQVSYLPVRAKTADFSSSYYYANQAVVGLKKNAISKVKTMAGLKPFQFGATLGTTSYDYLVKYIKPNKKPKVYGTLDLAVAALKNGQIDGLITDYPDTLYITAVQVPGSEDVGLLPTRGAREYFGAIFQKGNPLVPCVSKVFAAMWADGTFKRLTKTWLAGTYPPLLK